MVIRVSGQRPLRGELRLPGDKSISHRALLFSALAEGRSTIQGLLDAADVRSTARVLRALGVRVEEGSVWGGGWQRPRDALDCGNSGTTMRLMTGLLAGLGLEARLDGDDSLRRRPMERIASPLRAMGAQVELSADGLPPLSVRGGHLEGVRWESPIASAQVKSALLLAMMRAEGVLHYREPHLSRDHSERMLRFAGARLEQEAGWIRFEGGQPLEPRTWRVPGDISSALFFLVAGCICPGSEITLRGVGLNPSRAGALRVLQRMGAELTIQEGELLSGEPSGDLTIRSGPLRGVEVEEGEIPSLIDEIPVLAIAACFAEGETRFRGAGELRVKESNRLEGLAARIRSLGGEAEVQADDLLIRGGPLRGGAVSSGGDHRIAMAFAVAGLALRGGITLEDSGCVDVSFPTFFRCLEALGA